MMEASMEKGRKSPFSLRNLKVALLLLAGLIALGRQIGTYLPRFTLWVNSLGG